MPILDSDQKILGVISLINKKVNKYVFKKLTPKETQTLILNPIIFGI